MISKLKNIGNKTLLKQIFNRLGVQEPELLRPIIPVEQWVNDPYYIGKDGYEKLYPFWKDTIVEIFKNGELNYNVVVLTGGIGTGKSTAGLYVVLRYLYEISCYKNIAGHFNLMQSAYTVFLYFSLTKFMAERSGFSQFRSMIDCIPYFKEHFRRNEKLSSQLKFPEHVLMTYGTGTGDMIGTNVLMSILDEANFFGDSSGSAVDYGNVIELHQSIISRQKSRFTLNNKDHSLSLVISSSTFSSSYTEQLRKESLTNPRILFRRAQIWNAKPKGTYSDQFFYVFAGTEKFQPFVIDTPDDLSAHLTLSFPKGMELKECIARLPVEYRSLVDEVPVDFYTVYKTNVVKGLQDFSGFSVASSGKFFSSRDVFSSCIDDKLLPIFSKNEFVIETNNPSESNTIQYYLCRPFEHRDRPRFIHVDLGLTTDACGISSCYKYGSKIVDGVKQDVYYYDFSLRIVPPPAPKKISITRVEEFILYMRDVIKLKIGMVSFDQFQSASSMQRLEEAHIPVRYQSVDRTDKAYVYFVDMMYKECVYFSTEFADSIETELFNLERTPKGKIDHPSDTKHGGMKDRMDAIVGAMYNAFECDKGGVNTEDLYRLSSYNTEDDVMFSDEYKQKYTEIDGFFMEETSVFDINSADEEDFSASCYSKCEFPDYK